MHNLPQTERICRDIGHHLIDFDKGKTRLDAALIIEAKRAVLIGPCRAQSIDEHHQIGDHPIKVRRVEKLLPTAHEEHHEIGAQLRVGFSHLMACQLAHGLDCAFERRNRSFLNTKGHGRDGSAPAGEQIGSVRAGKVRCDGLWRHFIVSSRSSRMVGSSKDKSVPNTWLRTPSYRTAIGLPSLIRKAQTPRDTLHRCARQARPTIQPPR